MLSKSIIIDAKKWIVQFWNFEFVIVENCDNKKIIFLQNFSTLKSWCRLLYKALSVHSGPGIWLTHLWVHGGCVYDQRIHCALVRSEFSLTLLQRTEQWNFLQKRLFYTVLCFISTFKLAYFDLHIKLYYMCLLLYWLGQRRRAVEAFIKKISI